jgi:dTDP-4-dehydrorhamnose 3,5-epimerase
MLFTKTRLSGAWIIDLEPRQDTRGFFSRAFCRKEFLAQGIDFEAVQANVAVTYRKGTVRGLHYQVPPSTELKLMRCTKGAIFDVMVDMDPRAHTYLQYLGTELSAENRQALLVPAGFAHGYQALTDDAEVTYLVSDYFNLDLERGIRYDEPAVGIQWPLPVRDVSSKDLAWPLLAVS